MKILIFHICFWTTLYAAIGETTIQADKNAVLSESIKKQITGEVQGSFKFEDIAGQHILVLLREHKQISDEKEYISLRAIQFALQNTEWKQEWAIKDYIECEGLDISGDFAADLKSFTDLDSNKIVETTVTYGLICTGAIEPKTIKTIVRQGTSKYAVRGESLVRIDAKTTYGGTYKTDNVLDALPQFKIHLLSIWKKAAGI